MIRWTYFDTSAAVKLFLKKEEHAEDLDQWLAAHAEGRPVTSDLTRTELRRALLAANADEQAWQDAEHWLGNTALIRLTPSLCDAAGRLVNESGLRSLDALHLAAALEINAAMEAFVAYDRRLLSAAEGYELPVASPGAD
ncbi:type II toxin-antitoxin system VapC family toxin [Glycomyces sp. NPDC046736]|uniref:type II toxin-antitoxin system VapC family toxin n=1 Tax=Glycomyces sp. NPDC046736 TaxID=3155615 RepID=UPI0033FA8A3A